MSSTTSFDLDGLTPLLSVYDMPAAMHFYTEVLGFELVSRSPTYATEAAAELFHWAWLRRGTAELMLNTAYDEGERPSTPDRRRMAAHSDTGLYMACPDLDLAYAHLQAHGIACKPPKVAPYGMRQLSFQDPDGYSITLQHLVTGGNP